MSGLASKLRTYRSLMRYYRRNERFAEHDFANVFLRIRRDLEKYGDVPLERARLLEVGCGQHFSATLLFHSSGADVVGIDTSVSAPKLTVRTFARMVRENGAERAAKTLVRRALFDRPYYRVLEREFGRPLRFDGLDLRTMSATDLSFPDGEFDYVFSNAVFEHIEDVDVAVREIARVLSPGGLAWIGVHLFPSMSGGHCLDWAYPEEMPSASVPPWDHLRDNRFPSHVYLNRLREADYLAVFEQHLEVEAVIPQYEGKAFLTPEIRGQLGDYSDDDLLKRELTLIVRRPNAKTNGAATAHATGATGTTGTRSPAAGAAGGSRRQGVTTDC